MKHHGIEGVTVRAPYDSLIWDEEMALAVQEACVERKKARQVEMFEREDVDVRSVYINRAVFLCEREYIMDIPDPHHIAVNLWLHAISHGEVILKRKGH